MSAVHVDSVLPDDGRRARIYAGDLFLFSPRPSLTALTEWARELVEEAFAPADPRFAQDELPVQRFVDIVAPLKPRFIHHPRTKDLIQAVLEDLEFDMESTYFDVPRMRVSTSGDYLSSGVAYALHPHRDTWYSQPFCQLNWWLPIYDFDLESGFAFYPRYFAEGVSNGSAEFNYYEWNANGRRNAASQVGSDTRKQPKAEQDLDLSWEVRPVVPAGGLILFSGAQLHATVANTSGRTRFSVDFRTANLGDLRIGRGAHNVDSKCTGTSLRDLMRGTDRSPVPDDVVAAHDSEVPEGAVLVFKPEGLPAGS